MTGTVIETARPRLRVLREADLGDLVALIGDWQLARWLASVPHPYSAADGYAWLLSVRQDHAANQPRRFAIALRDTDRIIGGIGLDADPGDGTGEPALGYWLGRPYWGNGYDREAVAAIVDYGFRSLGMVTIRAYTDPDNAASQKVLLHCGFTRSGDIELAAPLRHGARWRPSSASPGDRSDRAGQTASSRSPRHARRCGEAWRASLPANSAA